MGCSPDGKHNLADVLRDADLVRGLQVDGQGGDAAPCAQGREGRGDDIVPERADALPAGGPGGVQGESDEEIPQGRDVVGDHGPQIGAQEVGAEVPDERGEVGEEADGRVVHDDTHQFQHGIPQGADAPGDTPSALAQRLDGDAEQDGEEDQGQHVAAGDQLREIADGEGFDDLVRGAEGLEALRLGEGDIRPLRGRIDLDGQEHDEGRDSPRDEEHHDEGAHDVPQAFHRGHTGHRAADRGEDQRDHHHEHGVDEEVPQGLEHQGAAAHLRPGETAQDDGRQQDQRETVGFPKAVFLLHSQNSS